MLDWITAYADALLDWITVNAAYAGAFVFLVSCLESLALVGILLPGMAIMLGIGALVGIGVIPFWSTIMWATLGAIVGDGISFWLGRHFNQRLHHIWPFSRYPDLIPKGEQFFHKHGELSILFGRFVGPLRAIVPAVAGMMDMSPSRFYQMNIISGIAWAHMVVILGAMFGASTQVAADVTVRLLLLVVVLMLSLWFFGWLIHRSQQYCLDAIQRKFPIPARKINYFFYISLIIIIISVSSNILTKKSAEISPNFKQTQWWSNQWRPLANVNPEYNVQYSGELSVIRHLVMQRGWYYPTPLTMKNALQWLAPKSVLSDLPLFVDVPNREEGKFNKIDQVRLLIAFDATSAADASSIGATKNVYLLSLQKIERAKEDSSCLWLGKLQQLTYRPLFFEIGFPQTKPVNKIPDSVIAGLRATAGIDVAVHKHNMSELMTIRTMEIVKCSTKKY